VGGLYCRTGEDIPSWKGFTVTRRPAAMRGATNEQFLALSRSLSLFLSSFKMVAYGMFFVFLYFLIQLPRNAAAAFFSFFLVVQTDLIL